LTWLLLVVVLWGTIGEHTEDECVFILPASFHHIAYAQDEWSQTGIASFYDDSFIDKPTTSGEKFSQSKARCAHPYLPIGTKIEVTNVSNDKSTTLIVNDRMPKKYPARILDMPTKYFKKIAGRKWKKLGLITVKVKVVYDN